MYTPKYKETLELMKGAYDLHMHPLPDVGPRSLTDFEAMEMMFIDALLNCGISEKDICTMTHVTPQRVLGEE